jgi:hypothetical protein
MAQQVVVNPESSNPVVVARSVYRGVERLDVRLHFYGRDGELRPTKKGVNLTIPDGRAAEALAAAQAALAAEEEFYQELEGDGAYPLVVRRTVYRGRSRVDLRRYYLDQGALSPSQKGVSLPSDIGLDRQVIAIMAELLEEGGDATR